MTGGVLPGYEPGLERELVILSHGRLYPGCCPGVEIVDHDGRGPVALLFEHHHEAHGGEVTEQ